MWNKESRRAARQAYRANRWAARQAYRAARRQYRASHRFYQRRNGRWALIFLFIILGTFIFSGAHISTFFVLVLPLALLGFLIAMIVNRAVSGQNPYQPPYDQQVQQPYQGTGQPYYQGPQVPPQPEPSPESYQSYDQGYQAAGREQEYRSPASGESYSQEEQPQALYPQVLPPMEQ